MDTSTSYLNSLGLCHYRVVVGEIESSQFSLDAQYFHRQMDFINWTRFFFLLKEVIADRPIRVLEVGVGGGFLRDSARRFAGTYEVLDINERLNVDYLGDVRSRIPTLEGSFEMIIAADVLEHVPFRDLGVVLDNLRSYLVPSGKLLVTIPHRRSNFMFMTPRNIPTFFSVPTGFLSPGAFYRRFIKRKIWIDPDHAWEIGDGTVRIKDVEQTMIESGFTILSRKKLFYVDFWSLQRP